MVEAPEFTDPDRWWHSFPHLSNRMIGGRGSAASAAGPCGRRARSAQHPVERAVKKLWAPVPWMLEAAVLLQLALGEYVEAP